QHLGRRLPPGGPAHSRGDRASRLRRRGVPHPAHRGGARPGSHLDPQRRRGNVGRYLVRKLAIYLATFIVAVSVNWAIPRLMPGNPVYSMIARAAVAHPEAIGPMREYFEGIVGLHLPAWQQYLN